jgi:hypothetical protein
MDIHDSNTICSNGFEGNLWPGRILSFVTGIITFTILTWLFKGEPVTMKTSVCLVLGICYTFNTGILEVKYIYNK